MKKLFKLIIIIFVLTLAYAFAEETESEPDMEKLKSSLVSISAEDAHLPSVLAILAEESGFNIVTGPGVNIKDRISIHLNKVPIEQAVNLVVRAAGLSYEIVGNSFLVAETAKLKEEIGIKSYVVPLQYANATEVKELLVNITEQVEVHHGGNKLLINTSPKKIAEVLEVIKAIDVPVLQIKLEARLIEVTMAGEESYGIDWARLAQITTIIAENAAPNITIGGSFVPGMSQQMQSDGSLIEQYSPLPNGLLPQNMYFQRIGTGQIGFSRQLSAFDLTLDLLQKKNEANILANSQVVTINGKAASIAMVDIVPYILSSGGIGGQVQVQREEVGIKLSILPTVNTDGYITTRVIPEVSSIYDFIGPERNIPWVKKRLSETTVRVRDGESIIIAGLLGVDRKSVENKLPFFGNLPYVGKFFTHQSFSDSKTDLIIEITPHIIRDAYSGIERTDRMEKFEDTYIATESDDTDDETTDEKTGN